MTIKKKSLAITKCPLRVSVDLVGGPSCPSIPRWWCHWLHLLFEWSLLKVFIEFVTVLLLFYVLVFWLRGMWDLSSLTRDWAAPSTLEGQVLAPGPPGKPLAEFLWDSRSQHLWMWRIAALLGLRRGCPFSLCWCSEYLPGTLQQGRAVRGVWAPRSRVLCQAPPLPVCSVSLSSANWGQLTLFPPCPGGSEAHVNVISVVRSFTAGHVKLKERLRVY